MLPGFSRLPQLANTTLTFSLKPGVLFDIGRGDDAAAEETDVGELVEMLQRDEVGLRSAHGEAGHGAMRLIGQACGSWRRYTESIRRRERSRMPR